MTTQTLTTAARPVGDILDTFRSLAASLRESLRLRLAKRAARRDLFWLDEHMMSDVGLQRSDLARAAMSAALVHRNGR